MPDSTLATFEQSLARCSANPVFYDRFYELFIASSPRVAEKFAKTDFVRQKRALRASLHTMLVVATDGPAGLDKYLHGLAERHSKRDLNIGAEFYDYWLDSLLAAVKEADPNYTSEVREAWEQIMMTGIRYLLSRY